MYIHTYIRTDTHAHTHTHTCMYYVCNLIHNILVHMCACLCMCICIVMSEFKCIWSQSQPYLQYRVYPYVHVHYVLGQSDSIDSAIYRDS